MSRIVLEFNLKAHNLVIYFREGSRSEDQELWMKESRFARSLTLRYEER